MTATLHPTTAATASTPVAAPNTTIDGQPARVRGLKLSFYRDAEFPQDGKPLMSVRHTSCLLVGVVDFRQAEGTFDVPQVLPLEKVPLHVPSASVPPVWLVVGRHSAGDRYLIPGDPATGLPDLRHWAHGGNFAWTSDGRLSPLNGDRGAIRVHDYREVGW